METRTCPHRMGAVAEWVNNDGKSPPVIILSGVSQPSVLSLTNQVIRASCPSCFERIRRSASICSPDFDT